MKHAAHTPQSHAATRIGCQQCKARHRHTAGRPALRTIAALSIAGLEIFALTILRAAFYGDQVARAEARAQLRLARAELRSHASKTSQRAAKRIGKTLDACRRFETIAQN